MATIVVLIFLVALGAYLLRERLAGAVDDAIERSDETKSAHATYQANEAWLDARWKEAERASAAGEPLRVPRWHFDPPTAAQIKRLAASGLTVSGKMTKGMVSDLVGIFEPIEDGDAEVLRFFRVRLTGFNQTRGRHEAERLLADPKNAEAWAGRPATAEQKEFYRFFGLKLPAKLGQAEAERTIKQTTDARSDAEFDEWGDYQSIMQDFSDAEVCADYEIKKPQAAVLRAAIQAARDRGVSLSTLATELERVAEEVVRLKPELRRKERLDD